MSPVASLVAGAVVLFIFCVLMGTAFMAVAAWFLKEALAHHHRYKLAGRGLDRDKTAGFKEVKDLIREIDGDHSGGQSGDTNIAQQRVTSPTDDGSLPSSGSVLRSLPAPTAPDEQFRKK